MESELKTIGEKNAEQPATAPETMRNSCQKSPSSPSRVSSARALGAFGCRQKMTHF